MIFTSFDQLIRSCQIVKTLHNFIYSYTYISVKPYIISISWIILFLWSHGEVKLYGVIRLLLSHYLVICKLDIWIESCCNNSWYRRVSSWSQVKQAFCKSLVLLKAKWLVYVMVILTFELNTLVLQIPNSLSHLSFHSRLSVASLLPPSINCWVDNIMLLWDPITKTYSNNIGKKDYDCILVLKLLTKGLCTYFRSWNAYTPWHQWGINRKFWVPWHISPFWWLGLLLHSCTSNDWCWRSKKFVYQRITLRFQACT